MCDFFLSVYYSALLYTDIEAPAAAPLNLLSQRFNHRAAVKSEKFWAACDKPAAA